MLSQSEPLVDLGSEPCYRDGLGEIGLMGHLSRSHHSPNAAQLKHCVSFIFYNLIYLSVYLLIYFWQRWVVIDARAFLWGSE